jgi:hypothetical protein
MYAGCNGATYLYTCCILVRACICGNTFIFISGNYKKGLQVSIGKWKSPFNQIFIG